MEACALACKLSIEGKDNPELKLMFGYYEMKGGINLDEHK
jgi:hypothetical protein